MVGIQVATLIVTEEKTLEDGRYFIDTHSHPVVNYANKEGLMQDLNYHEGNYDHEYKCAQRMQPEGAVWNKVEIRDVHVLGLVGANNLSVDLNTFLDLVPSLSPDNPLVHLWDSTVVSKIRNLFFSLERVGIKVYQKVDNLRTEYDSYYNYDRVILLEHEEVNGQHQVLVNIRDENYETWPLIYPLYFRCRLEDNPKDCINTIKSCFVVLCHFFDFQGKLKFICNSKDADKSNKWTNLLDKVADSLNSSLNTNPTEG